VFSFDDLVDGKDEFQQNNVLVNIRESQNVKNESKIVDNMRSDETIEVEDHSDKKHELSSNGNVLLGENKIDDYHINEGIEMGIDQKKLKETNK